MTFSNYSQIYSVYMPYYRKMVDIAGIAYVPNFSAYANYYKKHIIEGDQEYRPDKIAYYLWGNQYLTWVLNEINFFTHGIKEYVKGRTINYLEIDILKNFGIV